MYASSEPGYQTLIAGSGFRFEDPINSSGSWNNNTIRSCPYTEHAYGGSGRFPVVDLMTGLIRFSVLKKSLKGMTE